MKIHCSFLPLLGAALAMIASAAAHGWIQAATEDAPIVPRAYIIELYDDQDMNSFYNDLDAANVKADPRLNLSYSLFKGYSFQLKNMSDDDADVAAQKTSEMPNVRKIWPVRVRNIPKVKRVSTGGVGASSLPTELVGTGGIGGSRLKGKKRQQPVDDFWTPNIASRINKRRAEGYTGAGIRIGIVDTGVDYNHPVLGNGCFGPGCLISYGTDLVGDSFTGLNQPVPDPDPYDSCVGHGTHVSSTIAAQANELGFTGATPDVTLGMYRVFGCEGGSSDDILIAAFNQAYEDGSEIITASIGGPSGWSEESWAVSIQRIAEAGVPCTVSTGN
ncbi:peptidase S8/S53 domain-containing protein [Hypoxylon crocopeplum]|nr:peptidase S8/S53 domain-containing protein [Hypoxylon crocopeplum]